MNDPLEEILQSKTTAERFAIQLQGCAGKCRAARPEPRCEYYEHEYMQCKRSGGLCLQL